MPGPVWRRRAKSSVSLPARISAGSNAAMSKKTADRLPNIRNRLINCRNRKKISFWKSAINPKTRAFRRVRSCLVWPTKEQYIASESTFYRVLHEAKEQNHRGYSQKPGKSTPPKGYRSTGPNQVWTWDITYLHTLVRGMFFYLYMIVDVFSRKIVGWEVYDRENSENAAIFIQKAVWSEGCLGNPPVLHADNGSAQKGSTLVAKMAGLGYHCLVQQTQREQRQSIF